MMGIAGFTVTLIITAAIIVTCVDGNDFLDEKEIKVLQHLKRLNKPSLKSIKSEDGDVIDCVPITKQPAFDHPLLKNHIIQMRPSNDPGSDSSYKKKAQAITQIWHRSGKCPKNTVPIRRIKKEDLLRPKSVESFGRKSHQSTPQTTTFDSTKSHQYAIMGVTNGKFYGTQVAMNIWRPYVQIPKEFSLAQTWVMSGNGSSLNTIEAGWQVYPELYDDYNPRLFVYWTSDGYRNTGCYNLFCSGFVQNSRLLTLGASITPVSSHNGTQYDLSVLIWKDRKTGNWWLRVSNRYDVGYWPSSLFTSLRKEATRVDWGGEIIDFKIGGRHTSTDMGSGYFAEEGFGKASYMGNVMIVDGTNTLREPQPQGLFTFASNRNCYSVKTGNVGTSLRTHFFYGGSGRNPMCVWFEAACSKLFETSHTCLCM